MKKILSFITMFIFLIAIFNFSYAKTKNEFKDKYKLGCKQETQKTLAEFGNQSNVKKLNENKLKLPQYPPNYDLTNQMPPIGDQGAQGSCTAWATGYATKTYLEGINQGWDLNSQEHQMSPAYIYNQINGGVDGGSYITDALNLLINQGCATLDKMPYDDNDYTTQPSQEAKDQASHYKNEIAYMNSTPGDVETMKGMMNDFTAPLVIGIPVDDDFFDLNPNNDTYDICTKSYGGHAITLIGYSDTKQAFKIQNSWSEDWGVNGYGWISYDLIESNFNNLYQAYAYVEVDQDEIYPVPVQQKKVSFEKCSVKVGGVGRQWHINLKLYNDDMTKYHTLYEGNSIKSKFRKLRIKCREDDGGNGNDDIAIKIVDLHDGLNLIKVNVKESSNPDKVATWTFKIVVDDNYILKTHDITQKSFKVIDTNYVGKQWEYKSKISNIVLNTNQPVTTSAKTIYLTATEIDAGKNDVGYWVGTLKPGTNTIKFTVTENEGKYKGYKATVKAIIEWE